MRRVFWVSVGVVATVVVAKKWRELAERDDAVGSAARLSGAAADQVGRQLGSIGGALWHRFSGRAGEFVDEFRAAASEREQQLSQSLLAETQGDVSDLKARRAATRATATNSKRAGFADVNEFDGDEELLGYEF